jgi:hypothetical protein
MSKQLLIGGVKEGIVDLSTRALLDDLDVDELEHKIYLDYRIDAVMPSIADNVRRLFTTFLEHKFASAFSQEARVAMSGLLFGLHVSESLPIDHDAAKYFLAKDLSSIRNKHEFYELGFDCLSKLDFEAEMIPRISLLESESRELELWAGFGLVVSECMEVYDLEHNYVNQ